MNPSLLFVCSQRYLRLFRPLLTYLMNRITRSYAAVAQSWLGLRLLTKHPQSSNPFRLAMVAIGMLLAGWLGATQAQAQAPGGVSGSMAWWFKGDAGVTNTAGVVTQWNDQGANALNMTQVTASRRPVNTAYQNFNPVVTFDGSDALNSATGYWKSSTNNTAYNVFVVAKHTNGTGSVNSLFSENTSLGFQSLFYEYGGNIYGGFWASNYLSSPFSSSINAVPQVISYRYNNVGSVKQLYFNGQAQAVSSGGGVATFNGNNSNLVLGNYVDQGSWPYNGDIAEIVMYAADLSTGQRQQVESYLALKWGTTLNQTTAYNYLNSAGSVIWNATTNASYKNNIAGIGRDAGAGLDQRQSQSINSGLQVAIGNGSIAATNAANANSFGADQSFSIWGDNGASSGGLTTGIPTQVSATGVNIWMARRWAVNETGTVGNVLVRAPAGLGLFDPSAPVKLIVADDAAFTTNVRVVTMTKVGANYEGMVNFSASSYFTFGQTLVDSDGDTVVDLFDLDDDNDGVTDAVENQCPTQANWTTWASVSADKLSATGALALPSSVGTVNVTYSSTLPNIQNVVAIGWFGCGSSGGTLPSSYQGGIQTYHGAGATNTVTFSTPVTNPIITFYSNNGNTFVFSAPFEVVGTPCTQTINSNTSITGTGEGFVALRFNGTFSSISYTSSILEGWTGVSVGAVDCSGTADNDNDGIVNRLDLDSDGDGCSDGYEAGATTSKVANYTVAAPYGANGLANSLETVADGGITNYTATYGYAANNSLNLCIDSDNDNVPDVIDIDDDNDGALDVTENQCPVNANWVNWTSVTANSQAVGSLTLTSGVVSITYASPQVYSIQNPGYFNLGDAYGSLMPASGVEGLQALHGVGNTHTYTFSTPVKDPILVFWSMNGNTFNFTNSFSLIGQQGGVTASGNSLVGVAGECNASIQFYGTYTSISYTSAILENWTGVTVGVRDCLNADTDNDGVANRLDLDSDADGCSDAYEAGATANKTALYSFTGTVGTNGLMNSLETVADNGIINYASRYARFALTSARILCSLPAPGGIISGLDLWLKADDITGVSNGANLTQWMDSGVTAYSVSSAGYTPPVFYNSTASNLANFNPAVSFNGGMNMRNATRLYPNTSPYSLIGVGIDRKPYPGSLGGIMGIGGDGNYSAMDFQTDGVSPNNGWNFWTSGSSPAEYGGGYGRSAAILGAATTQANIAAITSSNSVTTTNYSADNIVSFLNGYKDLTTLDAYQQSEIGNGVWVGSSGDANYNGLIPEVIAYEQQLSDPDMQKVQTYLAIKYGTTLGQSYTATAGLNVINYNYVATDGTIIWSTTANSGYNNNIFGIGRDDAEALNQKQSRSRNPGAVVTIGNGTSIATTNAANSFSLTTNLNYELIGDNGRPASYSTVYSPTSFTPAGGAGFYRMARTWRVQETGVIGMVTVGVDASTFADRLLVSSNSSFTGVVSEIALTPNGTGLLVAQVNFSDGQYFTFGTSDKAPGGVLAGLQLWLKAESLSGTSEGGSIGLWNNSLLSNPNYDVTQPTVSYQPAYYGSTASQLVNFNPTVYFDGSTKGMGNVTPIMSVTSAYTFMSVGIDEDAGTGYRALFGSESSANYFMMSKQGGATANNGWHPYAIGAFDFGRGTKFAPTGGANGYWNGTNYTTDASVQQIQPQIVGISQASVAVNTSAPFTSWVDGYKGASSANMTRYSPALQGYSVGADMTNLSAFINFWKGRTPEQIAYSRQLSDPEIQQVNTYLAIKYGVTLGQGNGAVRNNANNYNYVATDGSVVWSTTANAGYNYDIAGIGFDNFEGLNQKQSQSVNEGFQPTIGLGTVAATNEANSSVFSTDKSYMVWGSNGSPTSYSVTYTPSFTTTAPYYTMNRIWKAQETGTVGTVMVSIPGNSPNTLLLVSAGTNFATSTGVTEYTMVSDGSGNLTAQVNLNTGQYFTFATPVYAPGCVSPGLSLWVKADAAGPVSSTVTSWFDFSPNGKNVPTVGTMVVQTPDAAHNYNPYFTGFSSTNYFNDQQSALSSDNSTGGVGTQTRQNLSVFAAVRPSSAGTGHIVGIDNDDLYGGEPAFSLVSGQPYIYKFSNGAQEFYYGSTAPNSQNSVISWQAGSTTANNGLTMSLNGAPKTFALTGMGTVGRKLLIGYGTWSSAGAFPGDIQEVIWYNNGNGTLTTQQANQIESYLAIKYGTTLAHNYFSGAGTTIYDVSSYSANVTGVGRDDCQQLIQKQSRSTNSAARMTISVSTTVASSNATNPGSFTADKSFVVIGDNGLTGTSALSAAPATACPTPALVDRYTNLAYKVTETGSVSAVLVQEDVSSFGFNTTYPVYMQVFSDAGFTNLLVSVPMSYTNGLATTQYDFPVGTSYVRFAGNTTAPANLCVAPVKQTFHWNTWYYGDKQKVLLPNYIPASQSATAAMTMSVTVTDPGNVLLYKPSVDWWPVFDGYGLFIPRNDNNSTGSNVVTTRMQFRQGTSTSVVAAQTVDFLLWDVDGWIGGRDVVKVYGRQGTNIISPQISQYKPLPFDALQINAGTNTVTGSNIPWDGGAWAYAYVSFSQPVEEVWVEYTKNNTYGFNVYNDLRVGPVTIACAPPMPKAPVVDNVYIYKEVAPSPQKTNTKATYKFTIQNTNCASRTINLTDNLPSGLAWVDSTVVASTSLTVGSTNAYGGSSNLTLSNVTVPAGTHYIYASVIGATAGVFNNQATYVVTNGTGSTLLSDDPSQPGTASQPTPLTLTQNDPNANLTMTKTVSTATAPQNSTLTYTYTINNPNATPVVAMFHDNLPTSATLVGGTLSSLSSGTASAYAGQSVLSIRDLSIPANSALSLTVVANVSSSTIGSVLNNVAEVTPSPTSGFQLIKVSSNAASTTIVSPPSVTINSPLNNTQTSQSPTISGTATPGSVVTVANGLGQLCSTTASAGGSWSCQVNLTAGPQTLTATASNASGTSTPATVSLTAVAPPSVTINSPAPGQSLATSSPTISGTATPGSNVTVTGGPGSSGGPVVVATNPTTGAWSTSALSFPSGSNSVSATAGNVGGSSPTASVSSFSVAAPLSVTSNPATQSAVSGVPASGSAAAIITPGGGTAPLTYSAFNPTSGSATSATAISTPHGTATINPTTGVYSYTPTAGYSGTDAIGIKVCDSSTPTQQCAATVIPINVAAPLTVNSNPATQTATSGTPTSGSAATALTPQGGNAPYTYGVFNPTTGPAGASTTVATPHGIASINPATGVYSYTPTAGYSGTDAIGIQVCDGSTPPVCTTAVIPVSVAPGSASGTVDCSSAQIIGIVAGTSGSGVLKLTINLTSTGVLSVSVAGSGLSASPSPYITSASSTGSQTIYVPLNYTGAAFNASTTISVANAGTCTVNMTAVTPKTVSTSVLNLGPACSPATAATLSK